MNSIAKFDDLLDIRTGGEEMMQGTGPTVVRPLSSLIEWDKKAESLRNLYRVTLGNPPADYEQELALKVEGEEEYKGCLKRTVSYITGGTERITAYILLPKNISGCAPGIVTIHPTNQTGREETVGAVLRPEGNDDRAYGLHLAQRGFVTISYDIDSTHDRIYPGCKPFENGPFYEKYPQWSARGKDIADVSRAIDVMEQMGEVDPARIGCIGHSQGGGITGDAMILEPRIIAGVNNCGDWPFRLSKNPFNRCRTSWWIGQPQLRSFAVTGKPFPVDLHEKMALAAPRALMTIAALNDFQFKPEEEFYTRPSWENLSENVGKIYSLYGASGKNEVRLHTLGHSFKSEQREWAFRFLENHLTC